MTFLRTEWEFLHLLKAVAVAANEARTVDEALQRALDEVCAYTGWPVGHAYLPGPDGVLAPTGLWHLSDPDRYASFRRSTESSSPRCSNPTSGSWSSAAISGFNSAEWLNGNGSRRRFGPARSGSGR